MFQSHDVGLELLHLLDEESRGAALEPIIVEHFVAESVNQTVGVVDVFRALRKLVAVVLFLEFFLHFFRGTLEKLGHLADVVGHAGCQFGLGETTNCGKLGQERYVLDIVDGGKNAKL